MLNEGKEIINQINNLKRDLKKQKLSVLVGAGFSKNVSNIFPSWWELLYDMICELYESEIEAEISKKFRTKKNREKIKEVEDYKHSIITGIISKVGYLEIVSEYIRRKTYKECVATYIEERIPEVIVNHDKKHLRFHKDGLTIDLTEDMMSLHNKLIQLPWNNIYTTNYDELLDVLVTKSDDIQKELKNIEKDIYNKDEEITRLESEINKLKPPRNISPHESTDFGRSQLDLRGRGEPLEADNMSEDLIRKKEKIDIEIDTLKKDIEDLNSKKHAYELELNNEITIVKQSQELGLKRTKNLIKLHGTLRKKNGEYGFDGDINKHYVIAKEDYEEYPSKHEAFVQLMRISLLQESFCLIGFSGSDPNFTSWLAWVRGIISKHKNKDIINNSLNKNYKVYLIDVDINEPPKDRKLFYENHNIFRIPLMAPEIVNFLQTETGITLNNDEGIDNKKELLSLFLEFLDDGFDEIPSKKLKKEVEFQIRYKNLWKSFRVESATDYQLDIILNNADELWDLKDQLPIFIESKYFYNDKYKLIEQSSKIYKVLQSKDIENLNNFLKLLILAMEDFLVPVNDLINENFLKNIEESIFSNNSEHAIDTEILSRFYLIKLRSLLLETLN